MALGSFNHIGAYCELTRFGALGTEKLVALRGQFKKAAPYA
jgi:hypothetical protein